jgi:hypothetical protein
MIKTNMAITAHIGRDRPLCPRDGLVFARFISVRELWVFISIFILPISGSWDLLATVDATTRPPNDIWGDERTSNLRIETEASRASTFHPFSSWRKGGSGPHISAYLGFIIVGVTPSDVLPRIRLLPDDCTVPLLLMPVEHSVIVV